MTDYKGFVRQVANRIVKAADATVVDLNEGLVEQEPHVTDRMLGRIMESVNGHRSKGVIWKAKTLTDHGPGSQERKYGADFVGVLDVDLPTFKVKKGFLAQSKLLKDATMPASEFTRLKEQCEQMLDLSPEAFVFLYSRDGIRVVPAVDVIGVSNASEAFDPEAVYSRKLRSFYEAHLTCVIGDRKIHEPSIEMLRSLRARTALELVARPSEQG